MSSMIDTLHVAVTVTSHSNSHVSWLDHIGIVLANRSSPSSTVGAGQVIKGWDEGLDE